MNQTLLTNWNAVVSPGEEVIFGGDLTVAGSAGAFLKWIEQLHGEIIFLTGNHDNTVFRNLEDVHIFEYYQFSYDGYDFYCTHRPEDVPRNWSGWAIHGHHHNNHLETYPFVNPEEKRVNISAEVLSYSPIHIDSLCEFIECGDWIEIYPSSTTPP
ncbi:hypothetical protein ACLI4Q_05990 [Natrialbaceae archaeon A-CW1-1]